MKMTLECECGNKIIISALPGKLVQFRDNLETQQFRYDEAAIKDDKLKEMRVCCDKCRNYMILGMD